MSSAADVRTVSVVRGVLAAIGRPVSMRALAAWIAVGLPAAVVFAPSGMRAADAVRLVHGSVWARVAVWVGWLVVAAPASRAVYEAPGALTLRSLRLARGPRLAALLVLASAVHAPWALLFARGGGALDAVASTSLAIALEALVLASSARPRAWVGVVTVAACVVWELPPVARALVGTALAPACVELAWRVAGEQRAGALRLLRPGSAWAALYAMYTLRLARAERARLAVATLAVAAGGAGLVSLGAEPTPRPVARALAVMALPLAVAAAVCVAPLLDCEAGVRVALRSLRVRRWAIASAFCVALASPASALAATAGAVAGSAHALPLLAVPGLAAWGAALGVVVAAWGRAHDRLPKKSTALFSAGVLAVGLAATGAWAW